MYKYICVSGSELRHNNKACIRFCNYNCSRFKLSGTGRAIFDVEDTSISSKF